MSDSRCRKKALAVEQADAADGLDQDLARAGVELAPVHGGAVVADQLAIQPHRRRSLDPGQIGGQAMKIRIAMDVQQEVEIGAVGQIVQSRQARHARLPNTLASTPCREASSPETSQRRPPRRGATPLASVKRGGGAVETMSSGCITNESRRLPANGGSGRPRGTPVRFAGHGAPSDQRPALVDPKRDQRIRRQIVARLAAANATPPATDEDQIVAPHRPIIGFGARGHGRAPRYRAAFSRPPRSLPSASRRSPRVRHVPSSASSWSASGTYSSQMT